MALRATKDTYVYETVTPAVGDSDEVRVRRQVFAGQLVPDHYEVENKGDVEDLDVPARAGTPIDYSHKQLGRSQAEAREAAGVSGPPAPGAGPADKPFEGTPSGQASFPTVEEVTGGRKSSKK